MWLFVYKKINSVEEKFDFQGKHSVTQGFFSLSPLSGGCKQETSLVRGINQGRFSRSSACDEDRLMPVNGKL